MKEGLRLCLVVSRLLASTRVAQLPWLARSLPTRTRVGGTCAQGRALSAACCRSSLSGSRRDHQLPRRGRLARETPRSAPASPGQTTTSCVRGRASRRRLCAPNSPRPTFSTPSASCAGVPGLPSCFLITATVSQSWSHSGMAASAASALLPAAQRIARQWRPPDAVLEVEVRAELPLQDERVLPRPSALRFQTRLCCVSSRKSMGRQ